MRSEIRRTVYRVHFTDRRVEVFEGDELEAAIRNGAIGVDDRVALSDGVPRRFWEFPRFAALKPTSQPSRSGVGADLVDGPARPRRLGSGVAQTTGGCDAIVDSAVAGDAARVDEVMARLGEARRRLGARSPSGGHAAAGADTQTIARDCATGPSIPASFRPARAHDVATGPSMPVRAQRDSDAVVGVKTEPQPALARELVFEVEPAPSDVAVQFLPPVGIAPRLLEAAIDDVLRANEAAPLVQRRGVSSSRDATSAATETGQLIAVSATQVARAARVLQLAATGLGAIVAIYALIHLLVG